MLYQMNHKGSVLYDIEPEYVMLEVLDCVPGYYVTRYKDSVWTRLELKQEIEYVVISPAQNV